MPDAYTFDLTGQQRAARVTAAFYNSRSGIHIRDVMRLTGLSRRAANDLLENLSCGIPIAPDPERAGYWRLVEQDRLAHPTPSSRPMFRIHPNTRAMIAFALAQGGQVKTAELARRAGLTTPEVRWLLQRLRSGGLPIDESGPDTWTVRKER